MGRLAGATESVHCGEQKLYFACDTWGDLFDPKKTGKKKTGKKKATWKSKSLFLFGGRWRFRTSDPSSVNAVLYP